MLFRQLEYFVALARERHFARAASACYVSQPALSEAIRKLENELKVPLVRRGQSFEGLTPEGERLVLWARRILADHDALKHEVTALQTGLTGELRLGVIPAASSTVALLTDPFCAEHPLVRVQLETSLRSAGIVERIRRFELDAGIIYPDGQNTIDLLITPLYEEQQVLIAGSGLLTGQSDSISWPEAVELPMCLLNKGMRGRQLIDEALASRNLTMTPRARQHRPVGEHHSANLAPHPAPTRRRARVAAGQPVRHRPDCPRHQCGRARLGADTRLDADRAERAHHC
jgi:DNA-binding transcriptional LysR family regulator